jgi:hypothetical protein
MTEKDISSKKSKLLKNQNIDQHRFEKNPNVVWMDNHKGCLDLTPWIDGKYGGYRGGANDIYWPFNGQPKLIEEIRPVLEFWVKTQETPHALRRIKAYLNKLWKFLHDTARTEVKRNELRLIDINQALIEEHMGWLKTNKLAACAPTTNVLIHTQVSGNALLSLLAERFGNEFPDLNTKRGEPISYSALQRGTNKLKSISFFANEYARDWCLNYLSDIDNSPYAKVNSQPGNDPTNPAHQKYAYEQVIYRKVRGEDLPKLRHIPASFWKENFGFEQSPARKRNNFKLQGTNLAVDALRDAVIPCTAELAATAFLISYETGFIDTVKNFDITGRWYSTTATDPKNPKTSDPTDIFADRPKTHKAGDPPKVARSSGAYGSAFWALMRIIRRNEGVRSFLRGYLPTAQIDPPDRVRLTEAQDNMLLGVGSTYDVRAITSVDMTLLFRSIHRAAEADPNLTAKEKAEVAKFKWKDTRDARALKAHQEGAHIHEIQSILGHKNSSTTMKYLREVALRTEWFGIFAQASGITFDELKMGYGVNRTIIRARILQDGENLPKEVRKRIWSMTASGAYCTDPYNPPEEIGNLGKGPCHVQHCTACHLAVFVPRAKGALESMATKYAELTFLSKTTPPDRFKNTHAEVSLINIREGYREELFGDRLDDFDAVFIAKLAKLESFYKAV